MAKLTEEELAALTDEELLEKARAKKSSPILSALGIGIMVGVVIFSFWMNTVNLFTLIPLFFALAIYNKSRERKVIIDEIKARKLVNH